MAAIREVDPVVRFCAVISRDASIRAWAIERLSEVWGEILLVSPSLPFEAGGYYAASMGENLHKVLVAFDHLANPAGLADWKHQTNELERRLAEDADSGPPRPLNLDPGYITEAKLVLATTKDRDHRIFLRDGIFAEVTLSYTGGRWVHHRWSYPDYRVEAVAQFASECRQRLRERLRNAGKRRRGAGQKPPRRSSR